MEITIQIHKKKFLNYELAGIWGLGAKTYIPMFYKEKYTGKVNSNKPAKNWKQFMRCFRFYRLRYKIGVPVRRFYELGVFSGKFEPLSNVQTDAAMYYTPKENNEPLPISTRFELKHVPQTPSSYDGKETDRFIIDEWAQNPLL